MQLIGLVSLILSLLLIGSAPSIAQADPLPDSGTYFIISASNDQALQPAGSTVGQNVLLYDFNKSGMQKWSVTRKVDPATKKPTNRYTIRLAGDNSELNLQPHPVADSAAIVSFDKAVFVLEPADASVLVKSVDKNGDAMYVYPQPPMNAEARFGPSDGSAKYRWKFVTVD